MPEEVAKVVENLEASSWKETVKQAHKAGHLQVWASPDEKVPETSSPEDSRPQVFGIRFPKAFIHEIPELVWRNEPKQGLLCRIRDIRLNDLREKHPQYCMCNACATSRLRLHKAMKTANVAVGMWREVLEQHYATEVLSRAHHTVWKYVKRPGCTGTDPGDPRCNCVDCRAETERRAKILSSVTGEGGQYFLMGPQPGDHYHTTDYL